MTTYTLTVVDDTAQLALTGITPPAGLATLGLQIVRTETRTFEITDPAPIRQRPVPGPDGTIDLVDVRPVTRREQRQVVVPYLTLDCGPGAANVPLRLAAGTYQLVLATGGAVDAPVLKSADLVRQEEAAKPAPVDPVAEAVTKADVDFYAAVARATTWAEAQPAVLAWMRERPGIVSPADLEAAGG